MPFIRIQYALGITPHASLFLRTSNLLKTIAQAHDTAVETRDLNTEPSWLLEQAVLLTSHLAK